MSDVCSAIIYSLYYVRATYIVIRIANKAICFHSDSEPGNFIASCNVKSGNFLSTLPGDGSKIAVEGGTNPLVGGGGRTYNFAKFFEPLGVSLLDPFLVSKDTNLENLK